MKVTVIHDRHIPTNSSECKGKVDATLELPQIYELFYKLFNAMTKIY